MKPSARSVPAQDQEQLVTVDAMQMCTEVRRRALGGRWSYANSGVFAGTASGLSDVLGRLHALAMAGHFEDQGMVSLVGCHPPAVYARGGLTRTSLHRIRMPANLPTRNLPTPSPHHSVANTHPNTPAPHP